MSFYQIAANLQKNFPIYLLKKLAYKWTCAVQTCVFQEWTVLDLDKMCDMSIVLCIRA